MTVALITSLNEACESLQGIWCVDRDDACMGIGWCAECWETARKARFNDKIVGKIDSGGLSDGKEDKQR